MEKVNELLEIINKEAGTCTASKKDEVRVMKALMNDATYEVDVYGNDGKEDTINPSKTLRSFCSSVLTNAAKIPAVEAEHLMASYEFKKSDAEKIIDFSKEFVNTYLHSGRKLPLGGREKSNIALALKVVPPGERSYPKSVGVDKNGNKIYASAKTYVQSFESVKVFASAPSWVK